MSFIVTEAEERYIGKAIHMIWKPIPVLEKETNTKWTVLKSGLSDGDKQIMVDLG